MSTTGECFLCGESCSITDSNVLVYFVRCPACGYYEIQDKIIDSGLLDREKAAIVAQVRKLHGRDRYFLCDFDQESLPKHVFPPISYQNFICEIPEGVHVFDQVLINLSIKWPNVHDKIDIGTSTSTFTENAHLFYCADSIGAGQILRMLIEMGYVSEDGSNKYISPKGWERLQELHRTENSSTAFVAMWFGDETKLYREAVKAAVSNSGYDHREIIVDEAHHNEFIMDKVANMIDEARFVISDFTSVPEDTGSGAVKGGVRGGVYFEAGYARGKNKEVIHTCRDDDESKNRLHFDVKQINTIFWHEEGGVLKAWDYDFVEYLTERIKATVGHGPLHGIRE